MVFVLTQEEENYRNNYVRLIYKIGLYFKRNYSRDGLVNRLAILFNDHGTGVEWLIRHLNNPESRGVFGSLTEVSLDGNRVILQPSSTVEENPEDYVVEIDRNILIGLTTDWENLVRKKVPEIFIFCKDGEYFVADALPEGIN